MPNAPHGWATTKANDDAGEPHNGCRCDSRPIGAAELAHHFDLVDDHYLESGGRGDCGEKEPSEHGCPRRVSPRPLTDFLVCDCAGALPRELVQRGSVLEIEIGTDAGSAKQD